MSSTFLRTFYEYAADTSETVSAGNEICRSYFPLPISFAGLTTTKHVSPLRLEFRILLPGSDRKAVDITVELRRASTPSILRVRVRY